MTEQPSKINVYCNIFCYAEVVENTVKLESKTKEETLRQFGEKERWTPRADTAKKTLEKVKAENGWQLVKEVGVRPAAEIIGISHMQIYRILAEHPTEPKKLGKVYIEKLEESEGWKRLLESKTPEGVTYSKAEWFQTFKTHVQQAFSFLGNIDPMNWEETEYEKLWEKYTDPKTGNVLYGRGTSYRRIMYAIQSQNYLLKRFKTKMPSPERAAVFWLTESDILALFRASTRKDLLIWVLLAIHGGSRISAFVNDKRPDLSLKPDKINIGANQFSVFEEKVDKTVVKRITEKCMKLLERYLRDIDAINKPDLPVFRESYVTYSRMIKQLGKDARITRPISSHIFKHTFAKQAALHNVDGDVAEAQAGTELRTLKAWYGFGDEKKIRNQMQGLPLEVEPFHVFMDRLATYCEEQYNRLGTAT